MFQLTYKIRNIDSFTHQITQMGAQFLSKGPEVETYYNTPNLQLRFEEGMNAQLVLVKKQDHFQDLFPVDIPQNEQMKELLKQALGEKIQLTSQVIRYHFNKVLLEIHRYDKLPDLLYLGAVELNQCKDLARILNLSEKDRVDKTSAELAASM